MGIYLRKLSHVTIATAFSKPQQIWWPTKIKPMDPHLRTRKSEDLCNVSLKFRHERSSVYIVLFCWIYYKYCITFHIPSDCAQDPFGHGISFIIIRMQRCEHSWVYSYVFWLDLLQVQHHFSYPIRLCTRPIWAWHIFHYHQDAEAWTFISLQLCFLVGFTTSVASLLISH